MTGKDNATTETTMITTLTKDLAAALAVDLENLAQAEGALAVLQSGGTVGYLTIESCEVSIDGNRPCIARKRTMLTNRAAVAS